MLFKTIAIILSTLFIAAVQVSTADAGCRPGHGAKSSYLKKSAAQQSRARKAQQMRAAAQKRKARQVQEARASKAAPKAPAAAEVAETAETEETLETVATTGETCTRFIASTGTTVSVPCSTE